MHAGWIVGSAQSAGPKAIEVDPAAGAAALVVAIAAALILVGMLRLNRLTKIRPGAASMELRPEPPAVVDLLTGGFCVEDDAVPATVVHLASRGWFSIEDYGDETIIRTRSVRPSGDSLQPYEQRVLAHIEHHAIDGVVPTRVLTTGRKHMSKRWFKHFTHEVVHHAQQLGLCTRRWGWAHIVGAWALVGLATVPAYLVVDTAGESDNVADWASLGNLLTGLAFVVAAAMVGGALWVSRFGAQKDTPAGVAAAAHWLGVREFYRDTGDFEAKSAASVAIWDHHLAYATSVGLAHEVQRQIPFESEHDRHAWSRATGKWRRVKVRYRTLRPGWGKHPVLVALQSLFIGALFGALAWAGWNVANATWKQHYEDYVEVTADQERWLNLGAIAVAVLAVAVVAHALVRFVFGCADMFRRRTVEGELVRARVFGGGDDSEPSHHLAIDTATASTRSADGDVDTILAYKVRSRIYHAVDQGARVRAQVSPLLGYVASIETLVPAPQVPRLASEPANALESAIGTWADKAGAGLTGAIGGLVTGLVALQNARLTEAQLNAVGPDGKTVREHLAESQAQLDAAFGKAPAEPPQPPDDGSAFSA
jgi:hypothetical protein